MTHFFVPYDRRRVAHITFGTADVCCGKASDIAGAVYDDPQGARICQRCWMAILEQDRLDMFNGASTMIDRLQARIEQLEASISRRVVAAYQEQYRDV